MEEHYAFSFFKDIEIKKIAIKSITPYIIDFGVNIIIAVVAFFVGRFLIKHLIGLCNKIMIKRKAEPSLYTFVNSLMSISLNILLIISIISIIGIDTSSFIAVFASAGLAIGMAFSGTLSNFAGGVMILVFHPYRIGHYIEAQGLAGIVKEIQIFNTILTTPDNQTIVIPNGALATGTLKNYSEAPLRRVDVKVEVAYGTSPEDVRNVLRRIVEEDERIIKDSELHAPAYPMTAMASSSIEFQLRAWTKSEQYWNVYFDTTEKVYNALNEAGIEIPFQQVDVHMKS